LQRSGAIRVDVGPLVCDWDGTGEGRVTR
jgi:hypothetical protein